MPLIEYTFEFLAMSGVEEVFVYCGAHTQAVEDYIKCVQSIPAHKADAQY